MSLVRAFQADVARFGVIVHYVIRRVVGPEVVLHRGVGVVHCHLPVDGVAGELGGAEQHFEVHHVVDDDGILPLVAVVVPRADALHLGAVAGNQRAGALDDYIFIRLLTRQFVGLAEAVVHHEAQVVRAFVPFGLFDGPGPGDGRLPPEVAVCVGIHLPQGAGEEARAPVVGVYHGQRAVFGNGTWHYAAACGVLLLLACLVGALHGELQLSGGEGVGVVHFGGLHVEQVEAVAQVQRAAVVV